MGKKVLVVGSGGREHAIVWKLSQSSQIGKIYVAPGNAGTEELAENVQIEASDVENLANFAEKSQIGLTVVGPELPLVLGIADIFEERSLPIFAPTKSAARIETSKSFARDLAKKLGIPGPKYEKFDDIDKAIHYVYSRGAPIVIKPRGLTGGKGVYVCETIPDAEKAVDEIMKKKIFGDAGSMVVIEEFLKGREVSIHALCGDSIFLFPSSRDYKRASDGDRGKNTGGMGTIAPVPWFTKEKMDDVKLNIIEPLLREMRARGSPYVGCLYPGLMVNPNSGKSQVLEFNARFGDPETQCLMMLLDSDLLKLFEACVHGKLATYKAKWKSGFAVCVMLVASGYPDGKLDGAPIEGVKEAEEIPGVKIFHCGTRRINKRLEAYGGRILAITAIGDPPLSARSAAYEAVDRIVIPGTRYRCDIGAGAL